MATHDAVLNRRPEIIVDFTVDEGLLTIHLKNIGGRSAYAVKTTFDRRFYGLDGQKCISEMRLFRNLEFMAPGKDLAQFVDVLANYAKRKQPMRIAATLSYRDREGNEPMRVRKLAGLTKFAPITLKRGITGNRDLWNWYKNVMNGITDRRNGSIVLLGDDRSPVARWNFTNGWPAKWEGPHLKAKSNEVAIETLEIEHEGLDYE